MKTKIISMLCMLALVLMRPIMFQNIIYWGGIDYAINIKGCKLHASATLHEGTHNGADIVKEIDKDRPCHLVVHKHRKYKDHSVLAVGYQKYTYKSFFYE